MLPATMLLQSAAAGAFGSISPDLIASRGFSVRSLRSRSAVWALTDLFSTRTQEEVAGFTAQARSLLPLFLLPFVGLAIDRFGHRFHIIAFTPLLWIIAYSLIGFSSVHPLVPVVFVAFAGCIQAFPVRRLR